MRERVECHYIIENHKVYIIQKDGKRIELNQYWYLKFSSSLQREQKKLRIILFYKVNRIIISRSINVTKNKITV